jgi:murein DD-endopeptidase MepM/ murein hydrolase activator NlpD
MKSAISTYSYPDVADCELIDWPVKDTWFVGHGGGTEHLNYHFVADQQRYAIDILKIGENGSYYENQGGEITDFYTFNEPVYAPVNGKVVKVVDSLPNADITFAPNNRENPAGNYIVIQYDTNRWLFLAHLNKGKVRVEKGDRVISGDLIGFAGNSGNTSWPHLHLHIQNQPKLNASGAKGIPFRFKMAEVKRWGDFERQSDFYPLRNDLIKPLR